MRYILIFLLSLLLFSCDTNPERSETPYSNNDDKPVGLFDTAGLVVAEDGFTITSKTISPYSPLIIIDQNKDTNIITFVANTGTYTTYTPDTTVRRYKGDVKPTDPPTPPTTGNYGTLTYSNNYDKATDINENQLGRGSISSFALTGTGSFRTEVRGSDPSISSGYRSEQQYDGSQYVPVEGVVEYDVYYENWTAVSGGGHSVQWHPKSSSGSAILSLQNYGGKFNVVRSLGGTNYHQQGTLMTTQPNKWYKMRWEIKWSTGSDGYIRLFIDNNPYYSFSGKTCDGVPYFKLGQNRWSMSAGQNTIVYYDNLKIWKR